MSTAKKRINISVSDHLKETLKNLSERDQVPVASKANELIRLAIEIEEDIFWNDIADERMKKDKRRFTGSDVWK